MNIIQKIDRFYFFLVFIYQVIKPLFRFQIDLKRFFDELYFLGVRSILVLSLTLFFVGMAFTFQILQEFIKFGATKLMGGVVALAMVRELSPLLLGVVASGRISASIAAEIGSMKVSEQIDALKAMGKQPASFLISPKLAALLFMMPLLVMLGHLVGFLGGLIIVMSTPRVNTVSYFTSAQMMLETSDFTVSLIKAAVFAFFIVILSSFCGFSCNQGAQSVGQKTTLAVVLSLLAVFISNFFLSSLLF